MRWLPAEEREHACLYMYAKFAIEDNSLTDSWEFVSSSEMTFAGINIPLRIQMQSCGLLQGADALGLNSSHDLLIGKCDLSELRCAENNFRSDIPISVPRVGLAVRGSDADALPEQGLALYD